LNIHCKPHNYLYEPVASQLGLVSLAKQRGISGIKFLDRLLRGNIDSPELLSLICFKVPQCSLNVRLLFFNILQSCIWYQLSINQLANKNKSDIN